MTTGTDPFRVSLRSSAGACPIPGDAPMTEQTLILAKPQVEQEEEGRSGAMNISDV